MNATCTAGVRRARRYVADNRRRLVAAGKTQARRLARHVANMEARRARLDPDHDVGGRRARVFSERDVI